MAKTGENPKPNQAIDSYIVMLHLRSQGWTNFTEIKKLLSWRNFKFGYAISVVGGINATIERLRVEWKEPIPKINAFVFTQGTECTEYICKDVFCKDNGEQPRPKEVAAHAAAIAAYDKWDQVIEVLRREAFGASDTE